MLSDEGPQVIRQLAFSWNSNNEFALFFFSRQGEKADLIGQPQQADVFDQISF